MCYILSVKRKDTKQMKKKKEIEKPKGVIPTHSVEVDIDRILWIERQLFLFDESIDNKVALRLIKQLKALNYVNDKTPITIWINCYGGQCDAGLSIIDAIQKSKAPIATWISGVACSMASLISIVGDARIMYKHAVWMSHPTKVGQTDYVPFIKDRMISHNIWQKTKLTLLKKHTKLTKKEITKVLSGEMWLTAQQCLKKGIIDKIV